MNRTLRFSIAAACALAALLAFGSCSKKQPKTAGPAYYADSIIAKARELTEQGYKLLDAKDLAGQKRLRGIVDMGAFETPPPAGSIFVVR